MTTPAATMGTAILTKGCTWMQVAGGLVGFMLLSNAFAADDTKLIEFRVTVPQLYFPWASFPKVPAYLAIRNSDQWKAFWSVPGRLSSPTPSAGQTLDPTGQVPDLPVDFEHFTLLAVVSPKPSGGYFFSITSIKEQAAVIFVSVLDVSPGGPGCAYTSMITYPGIFALIPKTDKKIKFQILQAKTDCKTQSQIFDSETP